MWSNSQKAFLLMQPAQYLPSQQLDNGPSIPSSQTVQNRFCLCWLMCMVSGPYIEKGFLAKCPRPSSAIALKWGGSYSSGVSSWYVSFMNKYLCSVCSTFFSHTQQLHYGRKQEDIVLASVQAKLMVEEAAVKAEHTSAGILSKVLQICTSILIKRHTWYLTELTLAFYRAQHTIMLHNIATCNCGTAATLYTQSIDLSSILLGLLLASGLNKMVVQVHQSITAADY